MTKNRTITNPIVGDRVTFLQTAEETGGQYTLVEVELTSDAKGTPLHYHTVITETFTVVEGELGLQAGKKNHRLKKGETSVVPPNVNHRFYNPSGKAVTFQVRLSPASPDFENSLRIAYALARDGQCNSKGIPKNLSHLALLFDMGEGRLPGLTGLLMPVLRRIATRAKRKGLDKALMEKYAG